MDIKEFKELLCLYHENRLPQDREAEFMQMMRDNPEARRLFIREGVIRSRIRDWAARLKVKKESHHTEKHQRNVRSWFFRTAIYTCVATMLIAFMTWYGKDAGADTDLPSYICETRGQVQILRAGREIDLSGEKTEIQEDDRIITGAGGRADLIIPNRGVTRLKQSTTLKVKLNNPEQVLIDLEKGKFMCVLKKMSKQDSFFVKTPASVAGVRGTSFVISANADYTVCAVLSGSVALSDKEGREVTVREKEQAAGGPAGFTTPTMIRIRSTIEIRELCDISQVENTGELEIMRRNIKALEILDQKTAGEIDAERELEGRGIDQDKKNISEEATGNEPSSQIREKQTGFEDEDDMLVK